MLTKQLASRPSEFNSSYFRQVVDGIVEFAVAVLDVNGNVITWNAGAEQLLQYRSREIVGRHYSCLFCEQDVHNDVPNQRLSLAEAEGLVEDEGWRVRKDGSRFWARAFLTAFRHAPNVLAFACVMRDRTGEEESTELLQAVLNHTVDGVISVDPEGIILTFNNSAEKIFGFSASEVIGQNVKMLMCEPQSDEQFAECMRTEIPKIIGEGCREIEARRKDGSIFPAELAVAEFTLFGRQHFTGLISDITNRKKMEEHLRQVQKMEAIGQLAGGVAHDFNNLLTIINGYCEILLRSVGQDDPMRGFIAEINEAGQRAGMLTGQLLAFSRKQLITPKLLDLNEEINDTEKMLRRLIGEHIILSTKPDATIGLIKVDPGQLQQVLINLAVNARDAMPNGGMLNIETSKVYLDALAASVIPDCPPGDYVMLTVTDSGGGMDNETKARLFEPFFTTKEVGRGTGLGLAVVHSIVKQCGGRVTVYSELGLGTAFRIYFPDAGTGVSAAKSCINSGDMPSGNETLLLAEDDKAVRALALRVLRSCGYTVLEASNGREALRLAESHPGPIDLLVSDIVMPHMGGRQLAEQLQKMKPGLKLLFLSGYTDDAMVRHGVFEAEYAFLQKPFATSSLAHMVRQLLDASPSRVGG